MNNRATTVLKELTTTEGKGPPTQGSDDRERYVHDVANLFVTSPL